MQTIIDHLRTLANTKDAEHLSRYFKTGPGEYGEGDKFLGIRVPVIRKQVSRYKDLSLEDVRTLLRSEWHEARLLALLILVRQYDKGDVNTREAIFDIYLNHTAYINNWDLVDTSAEHIVGRHLRDGNRKLLENLARSSLLWERRIAIMATFHFIKNGDFETTFRIADMLLEDSHDLIHKAVGWMIREVGNRDRHVEEEFLRTRYQKMPRTMLRYAIEKFPEVRRQAYLK